MAMLTPFALQEPSIDVSSPRGEKPDKIIGNIEFRNIHFRYPARPEIKVNQDTAK